jgi:carbon-monoxide dehydrogenase large subunit
MTITDESTSAGVIGERRLRKEDPPLLTGESKFIDDLDISGALWLGLVRSPEAHAVIKSIDGTAALAVDGVREVLTGADLVPLWGEGGSLPCAWTVTEDMANPGHLPVAVGTAKHVGDAVAIVLADSRYAAADGASEVVVEYEPLPAVVDLEAALEAGSPLVHDSLDSNACYTWPLIPDPDGVEAAFENAAHVVKERYIQQRLIPAAMEPRGVAAVPTPVGGELTLYTSTQIPHVLKVLTAATLGIPEHKLRVIAPAVGGAFGSKLQVYAEEFLCTALAIDRGVPIRWTETRSEAAVATHQGRGQVQDIELAADADGKIQAVRVNLLADMGAYLQVITPGTPLLGAFMYHGAYDVPLYSFTCTGVFTNKTPTDAYRGAGRPEATYAIERTMDALAAEIGVPPEEIRSRNFISSDAFPYTSPAGLIFDSGNYQTVLDKAIELADLPALRADQEARRSEGATKQLGIGFSSYVEMCGLAPSRVLASLNYAAGGWEAATVRILPTAKVQVVSGATPHGQGHETSWSMIVADKLGIDPDDVEVLHSDTTLAPLGMDTYGSRSLSVGGTAVHLATEKVLEKARAIAAHQLEANEEDLEYVDAEFRVKGTPGKAVAFAAIAFAAFTAHDLPDGLEPNLEAQVTWDPPNFTFPNGTHIAIVEVDTSTGQVDLVDYVAVDDCGIQVNPLIVEGQVHGGVLQGVAQALYEEAVYDDDGQLRNASLGDYLVPSAVEAPRYRLGSNVTPSDTNPLGVKGIGEAGTIASTPAVINAVVDALRPMGITEMTMPASPQTVWRAIEAAQGGGS